MSFLLELSLWMWPVSQWVQCVNSWVIDIIQWFFTSTTLVFRLLIKIASCCWSVKLSWWWSEMEICWTIIIILIVLLVILSEPNSQFLYISWRFVILFSICRPIVFGYWIRERFWTIYWILFELGNIVRWQYDISVHLFIIWFYIFSQT